ncbi:ribonuclease J [Lactovum miscens]|uniref:Ribonuclease J n=1 Tax=Lactovum miscens TaxID=190387 RepID=A0A841C5D2_9LACT|nr:ribonuclease J [Lactovum miscens]MBB5887477.1 ribonuclease J [Lactovum miscens]
MSKIKIIPIGGVREFGKNMYLVEVDQTIFVLDCGLKYPESEMLGVDCVIPDLSYLVENAKRIAGVFLTHGHADSIGALPYLLSEIDVPVFGSELTVELAKINTKNYEGSKKFDDFHIVSESTEIDFGEAIISFFSTTHTIPESLGVVVSAKEGGNVVYTGDFRFDPAVSEGYRTNMSRLAEIGQKGVLALLSASANSMSTVQNASEAEIYDKIFDVIDDWEGRVIIACNSGNIGRVQQVVDASIALGRHVAFTGKDMEQIVDTATRLKKLRIDNRKMMIQAGEIKKYPDNELVIIETGRMGEPLNALELMATNKHRFVKIHEGDMIYSVTSPSVAFETQVARTEDSIYRAGGIFKALSSDLRVSGHANARDLQFMLDLLRPKNLIPVQGEYRELKAHANLAMEMGIPANRIFVAKRGEVVSFKGEKMEPDGTVPAENVMIDGAGIGDIGSVVLRDRKVLSEEGIFIAVLTIDRQKKVIVSKAMVHTRGFVFVKTSRDLMKEAANLANEATDKYLAGNDFDWADLKGSVRDALGKFLYDQTKRKPSVLPIIMEARSNKK